MSVLSRILLASLLLVFLGQGAYAAVETHRISPGINGVPQICATTDSSPQHHDAHRHAQGGQDLEQPCAAETDQADSATGHVHDGDCCNPDCECSQGHCASLLLSRASAGAEDWRAVATFFARALPSGTSLSELFRPPISA